MEVLDGSNARLTWTEATWLSNYALRKPEGNDIQGKLGEAILNLKYILRYPLLK